MNKVIITISFFLLSLKTFAASKKYIYLMNQQIDNDGNLLSQVVEKIHMNKYYYKDLKSGKYYMKCIYNAGDETTFLFEMGKLNTDSLNIRTTIQKENEVLNSDTIPVKKHKYIDLVTRSFSDTIQNRIFILSSTSYQKLLSQSPEHYPQLSEVKEIEVSIALDILDPLIMINSENNYRCKFLLPY